MVVWTLAKNIQNRNRAHKVPILHIPGSPLCPVEAYKNMCRLVPLEAQHPAFALKSSRGPVPVTYQQFNQRLKNWLVHAASPRGIYPLTVSGGVGQRVPSRQMFQKFWFSCRVTGPRIVTRSICKWVWRKKAQCHLDWWIMLQTNVLVKRGTDWVQFINICNWGWQQAAFDSRTLNSICRCVLHGQCSDWPCA